GLGGERDQVGCGVQGRVPVSRERAFDTALHGHLVSQDFRQQQPDRNQCQPDHDVSDQQPPDLATPVGFHERGFSICADRRNISHSRRTATMPPNSRVPATNQPATTSLTKCTPSATRSNPVTTTRTAAATQAAACARRPNSRCAMASRIPQHRAEFSACPEGKLYPPAAATGSGSTGRARATEYFICSPSRAPTA